MAESKKKKNGFIKVELAPNVEDYYYVKYDEKGKEESRNKKYSIDKNTAEITVYTQSRFSNVQEIILKGFTELPKDNEVVHKNGYLNQKLGTLIDARCKKAGHEIKRIILEVGSRNTIDTYLGEPALFLNFQDVKKLIRTVRRLRTKSTNEIGAEVTAFLHQKLKGNFEEPKVKSVTPEKKAELVMNNLDESIIQHLSLDRIKEFVDFFSLIIEKRYKTEKGKKKIIEMAQVKIKDVPFTQLVEDFDKKLKNDPVESEWSDFLRKNLFLIDPSYIYAFPELHVTLGTGKRVDFGLVDLKGYLDIFEIKRSRTKLLSDKPDPSHDNYYWHQDSVKAIAQAEKYLHYVERKASVLAEDILDSTGNRVSVIKPKVILLIGNSGQLNNSKKEKDFRILRSSLKNIEIVLYDELYERIRLLSEGRTYFE